MTYTTTLAVSIGGNAQPAVVLAGLDGKKAVKAGEHFMNQALHRINALIPEPQNSATGSVNISATWTVTRDADGFVVARQTFEWFNLSQQEATAMAAIAGGARGALPEDLKKQLKG